MDWAVKSVAFSCVFLTVAKNVILAGVKSVTLYDPTLVQISDLSSQVRSIKTFAKHSFTFVNRISAGRGMLCHVLALPN